MAGYQFTPAKLICHCAQGFVAYSKHYVFSFIKIHIY